MAELPPSLPLLNGLASKQSKRPKPRLLPFGCLFLPLLLGKGDADLNVASGQKVTFCDRTARLLELTDGNKEKSLSFSNYRCNQRVYFSVFLGTVATVHFTSVHLEESVVEQKSDVLVKLGFQKDKDDEALLQTCGELADGFSIKIMVINCIWHPFGFDKVRVIFPKSRQVVINEIEVWSIGDKKHKNVTVIHRGCYLDFDKSFSMPDLPDVSKCFEHCAGRNFIFAALAIGMKKRISKEACFCSNTIPEDEVVVTTCDSRCGSLKDACGVKGRFSVYLVKLHLPAFVGCLFTPKKKQTRGRRGGTDVVSCLETCESHKYSYTMAGKLCYCDDNLWEGPLTGRCNEPCENSPDQVCGGQTAASVYSTCLDSIESVKCTFLFKCNERTDELGMCTDDCLPGYQGLHCLVRSSTGLTGNEIIDTARSRPDDIDLDFQARSTEIRFSTKYKKMFLNTLVFPRKDANKFRKITASKNKYIARKSTLLQARKKHIARIATLSQVIKKFTARIATASQVERTYTARKSTALQARKKHTARIATLSQVIKKFTARIATASQVEKTYTVRIATLSQAIKKYTARIAKVSQEVEKGPASKTKGTVSQDEEKYNTRNVTAAHAVEKDIAMKATASQEEEKGPARETTASQLEENEMAVQVILETVMVANIDINVTSDTNTTSFEVFDRYNLVVDGESTSWLPFVVLSAIAISAGFGFIAYKKFPKKKKVESNTSKKENSQNESKTTI